MENWKPAPYQGFPYEVSDQGRVRRISLASERVRKIHPGRNYEPKILTAVINNGYHYVTLCGKDSEQKRVGVHRLVLETFIGPSPIGLYGCHNDGNKSNNSLRNLRWDTPTENQKDRVIHGNDQFGEKNGSAKLTKAKAAALREQRQQYGTSYKKLGKIYGVSAQTAHNCVHGVTSF